MERNWVLWIGLLAVGTGCGKGRSLPGGLSGDAAFKGPPPLVIRGFEATSSLGRLRLTVFEGAPQPLEGLIPVGALREFVRYSIPREGAPGVPIIEEWTEALPGSAKVYFAGASASGGGGDPLQFSAFVNEETAERVRNPSLRSIQREYSRAISYCARYYFRGGNYLMARPTCQPQYFCTNPGPGNHACSLTAEGEVQCETVGFRNFLFGAPLVSRSFHDWIQSEEQAFVCQEMRVGRTAPVVLAENASMERLEWSLEPGVKLTIRIPNPDSSGEPWISREVQFQEAVLNFSWDK